MKRSISVLLAVAVLALIATLIFGGVYKHSLKRNAERSTAVAAESSPVDNPVLEEVQAATIENAEQNTTAAETEATEPVTETETEDIVNVSGLATANIDEPSYKEDTSDEDVQAVIDWLEGQPDIDAQMVADFIEEHPEVWIGYEKDADGNVLVPLNEESLRAKDEERVNATVKLGLNKTQIDDALAMPFTLTPDQVKKIKDSKSGVKIDFTDEELKDSRTELFRSWLENPILFEAYVNLLLDQKVGDKTVKEYWTTGRKFSERYDEARQAGNGMNLWLRQNATTGQHYTTLEYQEYVIAFIGLFEDKEMVAMPLTAGPKDHYALLWGEADLNSMRKANPADYSDPYAALWFNIHLKNGKIGIRIGANFRDKRPEIINYQATTKPVAKKSGTKKTTAPTPAAPAVSATPIAPVAPTTPVVPSTTPEYKYPNQGSASQGNASIGGGKNDDPGPGTWKPDQGNGNGTYVPGTSENPDGGNSASYDPGPAADATDGGTPPATTPITDGGKNNNSYNGGTATPGSNNGAVTPPPAAD